MFRQNVSFLDCTCFSSWCAWHEDGSSESLPQQPLEWFWGGWGVINWDLWGTVALYHSRPINKNKGKAPAIHPIPLSWDTVSASDQSDALTKALSSKFGLSEAVRQCSALESSCLCLAFIRSPQRHTSELQIQPLKGVAKEEASLFIDWALATSHRKVWNWFHSCHEARP